MLSCSSSGLRRSRGLRRSATQQSRMSIVRMLKTFAVVFWAAASYGGEAPQLGILTPKAGDAPRINGAVVYGVRPGRPVLYRLPVTGERPMKFFAANLPRGMTFDAKSGIVSGSVAARGEYAVKFSAENGKGRAEKTVRFVVGDKIALTPPLGWNSWNCLSRTIASAASRMSFSVTSVSKQFHEFQPSGGVSAILSPTTNASKSTGTSATKSRTSLAQPARRARRTGRSSSTAKGSVR